MLIMSFSDLQQVIGGQGFPPNVLYAPPQGSETASLQSCLKCMVSFFPIVGVPHVPRHILACFIGFDVVFSHLIILLTCHKQNGAIGQNELTPFLNGPEAEEEEAEKRARKVWILKIRSLMSETIPDVISICFKNNCWVYSQFRSWFLFVEVSSGHI